MLKKQLLVIVFTLSAIVNFAQVKINGTVYNEYLEPFYGAKVEAGSETTASDDFGAFTITISGDLPQVITVSAFGHQTEFVEITRVGQKVNVILKENLLLDQVVISASRVPERIIESPVTIERFGLTDIKKSASNSFYDGLVNLKGVQSREGSYGFKSINARGFSDFSNSRFVQMVDGVDTSAPALNFSQGNLLGVSELDILNVEVLPGASSALYGANAYNGLMLMNTKNPFDHAGISVLFKGGVTSQEAAGTNPFYDLSTRMAYKFSDAFAAKVNLSYFEVEEWHATDDRNKEIDTNEIIDGSIDNTIDYDGASLYGDELFTNISFIGSLVNIPVPGGILVNRTGYAERDLVGDYKSRNVKFDASLHYRPLKNESLEIIYGTRLAMGDNLFQGTSRFAQRNYYIGQQKLEIKGDNFYLRGYYTRNEAGNTYDLTRTGVELNRAAASRNTAGSWGFDYLTFLNDNGADFTNLENNPALLRAARAEADKSRFIPGTSEFNTEFNRITSTLITDGGSRIFDESSYVHSDGNYNFKSLMNDWADLQIGFSYRKYMPNSRGTIFNDLEENIRIEEYGFYSQIQKKFFGERLKLTGSIRYDKSQNFNGNYSPRVAVNYALGEDKDHILRASFQTGFRNPTIQEQYLFLPGARKTSIGTVGDNLRRISYPGSEYYAWNDQLSQYELLTRTVTGDEVINNSLLTTTVYSDDPTYDKSIYSEVTPESVRTFELGYRSMIQLNDNTNLDLDINGFYSKHDDFVFTQDIVTPNGGRVYPLGNRQATPQELALPEYAFGRVEDGVVIMDEEANVAFNQGLVREFNIITNAKSQVESYGFGIGMHTKVFTDFDFGVNYNFIDFRFDDKDNGQFEPNFNTPKHTVKAQFGNDRVFKNFGFNVSGRWLDQYRWVSPFAKGNVAARTVIDAQINYRIPSMKSKFKIGGTNLFGDEYFVAPGTGQIGQIYYISWIINN
jgi:outer membrane receptor protein involved in Fe transport